MSAFWSQFCIEKSRWERESCPLSGIEKRPPLGGYVSIKVMLDTIRNTTVVRCREAVLFSEGPLSEARLYKYKKQLPKIEKKVGMEYQKAYKQG